VALEKQELWRQLRDAEAVSPGPARPRRRRLRLLLSFKRATALG